MSDSEVAMGRAAGLVLVQFLNAIIVVASPRVHAKLDGASLREHTLDRTRDFLDMLEQMRPSRANAAYDDTMFYMEAQARELQAHALGWSPAEGVCTEVVESARACLRAYGTPEPPGGWEQFEG